MFELDLRASLEVAGEQREEHIRPGVERVEQRADARHRRLHALAWHHDFLAQQSDVGIAQAPEQILVEIAPDRVQRVVQDDPVRAPGNGDAVERA